MAWTIFSSSAADAVERTGVENFGRSSAVFQPAFDGKHQAGRNQRGIG